LKKGSVVKNSINFNYLYLFCSGILIGLSIIMLATGIENMAPFAALPALLSVVPALLASKTRKSHCYK
jgi:hypothetical protein